MVQKTESRLCLIAALILVVACTAYFFYPKIVLAAKRSLNNQIQFHTEVIPVDSIRSLKDVRTHAEKKFIPIIVGGPAAKEIRTKVNIKAEIWLTKIAGLYLLHMPSTNIKSIQELASVNEKELFSIAKFDRLSKRKYELNTLDINVKGATQMMQHACKVKVHLKSMEEKFTISSGHPVSIIESCRIFAWMFALHEIRLNVTKNNGYVVEISKGHLH